MKHPTLPLVSLLSLAPVLALAGATEGEAKASAAAPEAESEEADESDESYEYYDDVEYTDRNTIEVGGSLALSYINNDFLVSFAPQFGWFFADRWELSTFIRVNHSNIKQSDGTRSQTTSGGFEIEPSYHHTIRKELLYVFGGVGLGMVHDGEHPAFDAVPRAGFNIAVGRSGFLNPAVRMPILVGNITGPDRDEPGVVIGVAFELGFTTAF
jgi:hypothetical protein